MDALDEAEERSSWSARLGGIYMQQVGVESGFSGLSLEGGYFFDDVPMQIALQAAKLRGTQLFVGRVSDLRLGLNCARA